MTRLLDATQIEHDRDYVAWRDHRVLWNEDAGVAGGGLVVFNVGRGTVLSGRDKYVQWGAPNYRPADEDEADWPDEADFSAAHLARMDGDELAGEAGA